LKEDLKTIKLIELIRKEMGISKISVIMGISVILFSSISLSVLSFIGKDEVILNGVSFSLKGGIYGVLIFGIIYFIIGVILWLKGK